MAERSHLNSDQNDVALPVNRSTRFRGRAISCLKYTMAGCGVIILGLGLSMLGIGIHKLIRAREIEKAIPGLPYSSGDVQNLTTPGTTAFHHSMQPTKETITQHSTRRPRVTEGPEKSTKLTPTVRVTTTGTAKGFSTPASDKKCDPTKHLNLPGYTVAQQESDFLALSSTFIKEDGFTNELNNGTIKKVWDASRSGVHQMADGYSLNWRCTINNNTRIAVLVSGRSENTLLHMESLRDFHHHGFDACVYDQRGQGANERFIKDRPEVGDVNSFDDYVTDLREMIEFFNVSSYPDRFLLGHSMGATMTALYLENNPQVTFNASVLSAPMFEIDTSRAGFLGNIGISSLVRSGMWSGLYTAFKHRIVLDPYQERNFTQNDVTNSEPRFNMMQDLYRAMPELKLAPATVRWVVEARDAGKNATDNVGNMPPVPTLVLQAGCDVKVKEGPQIKFAQDLNAIYPNITGFYRVGTANHGSIFDSWLPRAASWSAILGFMNVYSGAGKQQDTPDTFSNETLLSEYRSLCNKPCRAIEPMPKKVKRSLSEHQVIAQQSLEEGNFEVALKHFIYAGEDDAGGYTQAAKLLRGQLRKSHKMSEIIEANLDAAFHEGDREALIWLSKHLHDLKKFSQWHQSKAVASKEASDLHQYYADQASQFLS
ncbi:alpha/beta fold hydrolase [Endozoicomonas elysicola]|nr:alpha/beta fold hydrolase [Endozoicomonas elysicola]